ncbi:MAG: SecD/SecF family protein translocase subunit, partial [Acidimicrobiales bacterium]|nr:SecD/SecF family protein translocase subunit [Acidimicrobiales bacterium]
AAPTDTAPTSTGEPAPPATDDNGDPIPTTTFDQQAFEDEFAAQWELTDPADATDDGNVVYAEYVGEGADRQISRRHLLGPLQLDGEAVADADARNPGFQGWIIDLELSPANSLDPLATQCFNGAPTCPRIDAETGRLAIVLDGEVQFAGTVGSPTFDGNVQLSGNYDQDSARDLAITLRAGALPIEFEDPTTQQVSASIGRSALDAGIIAGLVGLGLVALYILAYYRVLGLVALASLAISGALLWTIVAWLGESQGLTLTLAGITGLIVSIGVSVDSNIVYFEHLREDVRNGRTPRSAVDRAFPVAFSTIVKADVASLIGAILLYFLTTGAVRGFAFYLGLSVILDLVATYFFMGPAVRMITRGASFDENPGKWGVPARRRAIA